MKLSKEEQEKIILKAFDLQKEKFDDSWATWDVLTDAVVKMAKINMQTAAEMLKSLMDEHPDVLQEEDHENVFTLLLFEMIETFGEEKAWKVITYNDFLKKAFFEKCGYLDEFTYDSIGYFASNDNVNLADELISLTFANEHLKDLPAEVLSRIWWAMKNWSDQSFFWKESDWAKWNDAVLMLKRWIDTIPDEASRIKLEQEIEKNNIKN